MTTNPFDDPDGTFHVLLNEQHQYSLWPTFAPVPEGWTIVLESASRPDCAAYITVHWTDMHPHPATG